MTGGVGVSNKNNTQFLLSVISNADDLKLISDKFNLGLSDSVLRNGVEFDDRVLVIYGTKKRNEMCQKKLPKILDSMDKTYDPNKFIYLTEANLKEFVDKELALMRGEITEEEVEEEVIQEPLTPPKEQATATESPEPLTEVDSEETVEVEVEAEAIGEIKVGEEKQEEEEEVQLPPNLHSASSGLCRYGVPKMHVEYQPPNVLGLQESLFVSVEEATVKEFFSSVKERVLAKANEGF